MGAQAPLEGRLREQGQPAVTRRPGRQPDSAELATGRLQQADLGVVERAVEQSWGSQGQQVLHLVVGCDGAGKGVHVGGGVDDERLDAKGAEACSEHRAHRSAPDDQDLAGPRVAFTEHASPEHPRASRRYRRAMLRSLILAASRNERVHRFVAGAPLSRRVVRRFVAGESVDDAVRTSRELTGKGLAVSLDHLGEDTTDAAQAAATVQAYLVLLDRLSTAGLTRSGRVEVSVKLSAVGQSLDEELALEGARTICAAAQAAGSTVTLDMEDHFTTDRTLATLAELRKEFPSTGAVVQAYLHRTEDDCRALALEGYRVRLCKGAYREPVEVAYQSGADVDASYQRCLKVLMDGPGYPMVATHDPAMITLATASRAPGSFELQLLYDIRPLEQERLVAAGHTVRVYVPYGEQWYGYLMRRLAERPANLVFFLRALAGRS